MRDGSLVALRGNPSHPYSRGGLCPKVNRYLDRVHSEDRVLRPLVRRGPKGSGRFEPIAWDDALELVAQRVGGVVARHGGEALASWTSAGSQGLLARHGLSDRFLLAMGASRQSGTLCGGTAAAGLGAVYGDGRGMDPEELEHSRFVILWGTNTVLTNRHLWPVLERARARGATLVVIDPLRTATAARADWFVQPLPGTDVALALAIAHVVVRDGHVDGGYVRDHTQGFDSLAAHVASWTPERAARATGLDAAEIERLATAYATTAPAAIRTLIGPEHHSGGGALYRALASLPLLIGAWRHRGGGIAGTTTAWFDGVLDAPSGPALRPERRARRLNVNQIGRWLTDPALEPPVEALLVWNGNPAVSAPDAGRVRAGLAREDLFCVVHEQFLTDTALHADVVLPATTPLEALDVVPSWGHLHLGWNEPATEPLGEAVPNTELFRRLAAALGVHDEVFARSDEELLDTALAPLPAADRAALRREGHLRLGIDTASPYVSGGFATADGKARLGGSAWASIDGGALPGVVPPRLAHPDPGDGADPEGEDALHPLVLLSVKGHARFLNSSYSHLARHGGLETPPTVELSPGDAASRGISDGDVVRVFNARGRLELRALVSDRVRDGVVAMAFGWWRSHHGGGGLVNELTGAALNDLGGGNTYLDARVEVVPVAAEQSGAMRHRGGTGR